MSRLISPPFRHVACTWKDHVLHVLSVHNSRSFVLVLMNPSMSVAVHPEEIFESEELGISCHQRCRSFLPCRRGTEHTERLIRPLDKCYMFLHGVALCGVLRLPALAEGIQLRSMQKFLLIAWLGSCKSMLAKHPTVPASLPRQFYKLSGARTIWS